MQPRAPVLGPRRVVFRAVGVLAVIVAVREVPLAQQVRAVLDELAEARRHADQERQDEEITQDAHAPSEGRALRPRMQGLAHARGAASYSRRVRYEGRIFRPPSEAGALILQATIGCSWNHCTYCDMYRDKAFRLRDLDACLEDLEHAAARVGDRVDKLFVADGDALVMPMSRWLPILERARRLFPRLRRVSCYAMARNVRDKTDDELRRLAAAGLSLLYIGPESGDDETLRRIAKGDTFEGHVEAARRAHEAGMKVSAIALLGVAPERSREHAEATARLVTAMDPAYFAALTVTVVPGTPLAKLRDRGRFEVPGVPALLRELRTMVELAEPTDALFRTNHASNHLPLGGRLPRDRARIVGLIDAALRGEIPLRPEGFRGL